MKTYHKIQTLFLRDPETNYKNLLLGQFAKPEFEYLKNLDWVFTEKVDGTNIRIQWDGEIIKIKGKTDKADLHKDLLSNIKKILQGWHATFPYIFKNPTDNPTEVCLYGEGCGAGIQKGGGNYSQDKTFVLFDILVAGIWMARPFVEEVADALNISIVPIIGTGKLQDLTYLVEHGFYSKWGNFQAEGVVARPEIELRNNKGERVITKLKYKDFIQ